MSDKQTWKEPKTSTIRLLGGETVQAEVNGIAGKSNARMSGYAYVNDREIKVERTYDSEKRTQGQWYEQAEP